MKLNTSFNLGRKYAEDVRDKNYLITEHLLSATTATTHTGLSANLHVSTTTSKYWDDAVWWGDQGNTPQCVGYAWEHWDNDGPVYHSGSKPHIQPSVIYAGAQKLDPWSGVTHDGTTIRAGATFLKNYGLISSYYWGYDLNTLVNTVLNLGPVVVGTNWYYNMFFPNSAGLIKVGGYLAGGHAYVINGVATQSQLFRIKNSWGKSWGQGGHAYISFSDMAKLISQQGEVCLAVEIPS